MKRWNDGEVNGIVPQNKRITKQIDRNLFIYVLPSGRKVWYVRYTDSGTKEQKSKKIGIFAPGKSDHISVVEAKEQAAIIAGTVRRGEPLEATTVLFSNVAEAWLEDYVGSKRNTTAQAAEYRYKKYIETAPFYKRRLSDVSRLEIHQVLSKLKKTPPTAQRVHSLYNLIFDYAIGTGYLTENQNPMPKFKYVVSKHVQGSSRAAVTDDPERFGEIVMRIKTQYETGDNGAGLLLFLAYCFTRPGEARLLQWHNVLWKKNRIELSGSETKTSAPLIIPLSSQVIDLLNRQKARRISPIQPNDYIFFSPMKGPKFMLSDATPTDKLVQLGIDRREQSAHGFRSCASTYLREYLNTNSDIVEMQLNHVLGTSVSRIYDKSQRLDERKEMMQRWSDWVDEQSAKALDRLQSA